LETKSIEIKEKAKTTLKEKEKIETDPTILEFKQNSADDINPNVRYQKNLQVLLDTNNLINKTIDSNSNESDKQNHSSYEINKRNKLDSSNDKIYNNNDISGINFLFSYFLYLLILFIYLLIRNFTS